MTIGGIETNGNELIFEFTQFYAASTTIKLADSGGLGSLDGTVRLVLDGHCKTPMGPTSKQEDALHYF